MRLANQPKVVCGSAAPWAPVTPATVVTTRTVMASAVFLMFMLISSCACGRNIRTGSEIEFRAQRQGFIAGLPVVAQLPVPVRAARGQVHLHPAGVAPGRHAVQCEGDTRGAGERGARVVAGIREPLVTGREIQGRPAATVGLPCGSQPQSRNTVEALVRGGLCDQLESGAALLGHARAAQHRVTRGCERRQPDLAGAEIASRLDVGAHQVETLPSPCGLPPDTEIDPVVEVQLVAAVADVAEHVRAAIAVAPHIHIPLRRLVARSAAGAIEAQAAIAPAEAGTQQQAIAQPLVESRALPAEDTGTRDQHGGSRGP